jgi:hypothetical protein
MIQLKINIDCGKKTCERKIYRGCHYVKMKNVVEDCCCLFGATLSGHNKHVKNGSYCEHTRCKECLEAEGK